jgi:hypothetical protein
MAVASAQGPVGQPGAINFIDGQVALEGKSVAPGSLEGVAATVGQTLSTVQGKAELLLTPGAFLQVGDHSAVKMTSFAAADTQVELVSGAAILEVVQPPAGRLEVLDGQAHITVVHAGIYEFHAGQASAAAIEGRARVVVNDHSVELTAGRELTWSGGAAGATGKVSHATLASDALYAWSRQRAAADARASIDTAQALVGTDPANFRGPGWYWNPFYGEWGFLPATYTIKGPFGEEYYSARFYWQYAAAETHSHGYFDPAL